MEAFPFQNVSYNWPPTPHFLVACCRFQKKDWLLCLGIFFILVRKGFPHNEPLLGYQQVFFFTFHSSQNYCFTLVDFNLYYSTNVTQSSSKYRQLCEMFTCWTVPMSLDALVAAAVVSWYVVVWFATYWIILHSSKALVVFTWNVSVQFQVGKLVAERALMLKGFKVKYPQCELKGFNMKGPHWYVMWKGLKKLHCRSKTSEIFHKMELLTEACLHVCTAEMQIFFLDSASAL